MQRAKQNSTAISRYKENELRELSVYLPTCLSQVCFHFFFVHSRNLLSIMSSDFAPLQETATQSQVYANGTPQVSPLPPGAQIVNIPQNYTVQQPTPATAQVDRRRKKAHMVVSVLFGMLALVRTMYLIHFSNLSLDTCSSRMTLLDWNDYCLGWRFRQHLQLWIYCVLSPSLGRIRPCTCYPHNSLFFQREN